MIHPHTALRYIDPAVGYGVVATQPIPRGTITWALDPLDQLLDDVSVPPRFAPLVDKYTYRTASGQRLLAWDLCRFMNHSCEANTFSPGLDLEIAIRDIAEGEELTSDYAALNLEAGFTCLCGAAKCRGWVADEQFELLAPTWDEQIREAFRQLPAVEQPLWDLVANPTLARAAARDPRLVPSILSTRFVAPASAERPRVAG